MNQLTVNGEEGIFKTVATVGEQNNIVPKLRNQRLQPGCQVFPDFDVAIGEGEKQRLLGLCRFRNAVGVNTLNRVTLGGQDALELFDERFRGTVILVRRLGV